VSVRKVEPPRAAPAEIELSESAESIDARRLLPSRSVTFELQPAQDLLDDPRLLQSLPSPSGERPQRRRTIRERAGDLVETARVRPE